MRRILTFMPSKIVKTEDMIKKIESKRGRNIMKSLFRADCLTDLALRDIVEYILELQDELARVHEQSQVPG